jgi:hypothetical protein
LTTIAYPLLVLVVTHSPAKAGFVGFARSSRGASCQEEREVDTSRLRSQLAAGFRFLWSQPFLRTCAFLYGLGNLTIPGVLLVVVVVGQRQRLSGGEIGLLIAAFGACTLVGSLVSPLLRRSFSARTILLLELWAGLGGALFIVWPGVYVLTAGILPQAVVLPVTDSVVVGYRIAITPGARSALRSGTRRASMNSTISRRGLSLRSASEPAGSGGARGHHRRSAASRSSLIRAVRCRE